MKGPFISEIAAETYAINDYGMSTMYLLVGWDRALLLDCGVGLTDLDKAVKGLTDKPTITVVTHAHLDHVGGADQLDELYMHDADRGMFAAFDAKERDRYISHMAEQGCAAAFELPQPVCVGRKPVILSLEDGMVFDLGGRRAKVLATPGHTPGSCVVIDDMTRILFSGDACNSFLGVTQTSVATAFGSLQKIKLHHGEFDRNFTGHVGWGGAPNCLSVADRILSDCIWICEHILAGDAPVEIMPESVFGKNMSSVVHGEARIIFDPNRINI